MTRLLFWDVDTQYDVMRTDGKLYVAGSEEIIPVLQALTDFAHEHRIPIVASVDNHEPDDAEISDHPDWRNTFPPHSMRDTPGQAKLPETALRDPLTIEPDLQDPGSLAHRILGHRGDYQLLKRSLDVFTNSNATTLVRSLEPEAVVLYGVATDLGARHAIEGILRHLAKTELYLVTDATRAIDSREAGRLMSDWEGRGVRLVHSAQILHEGLLDPYLPTATV